MGTHASCQPLAVDAADCGNQGAADAKTWSFTPEYAAANMPAVVVKSPAVSDPPYLWGAGCCARSTSQPPSSRFFDGALGYCADCRAKAQSFNADLYTCWDQANGWCTVWNSVMTHASCQPLAVDAADCGNQDAADAKTWSFTPEYAAANMPAVVVKSPAVSDPPYLWGA